jgi:hypothetical protein
MYRALQRICQTERAKKVVLSVFCSILSHRADGRLPNCPQCPPYTVFRHAQAPFKHANVQHWKELSHETPDFKQLNA